jgi:hypothetical protein
MSPFKLDEKAGFCQARLLDFTMGRARADYSRGHVPPTQESLTHLVTTQLENIKAERQRGDVVLFALPIREFPTFSKSYRSRWCLRTLEAFWDFSLYRFSVGFDVCV